MVFLLRQRVLEGVVELAAKEEHIQKLTSLLVPFVKEYVIE